MISALFFQHRNLPGFFYKLPFSTGGQWHCSSLRITGCHWSFPTQKLDKSENEKNHHSCKMGSEPIVINGVITPFFLMAGNFNGFHFFGPNFTTFFHGVVSNYVSITGHFGCLPKVSCMVIFVDYPWIDDLYP